jgi:uncharacterized protein YjbI with pentapeptide repeats
MKHSHIAMVVIGVLLIAQVATPERCIGQELCSGKYKGGLKASRCTGKYKGGLKPPPAELMETLKQHATWVKDGGPDHLDDPKVANDPRRANFCEADLSNTDLKDAHLEKADLSDANLDGAHLDRAHFNGAYFSRANLDNAYLSDAELNCVDLRYAHLYFANLSGTYLNGTNLTHADLSGADLGGSHLRDANLNDADLSGAHLGGGLTRGADLSDAHLERADLNDADLYGVDLSDADLKDAHLEHADLAMANVATAYLDCDPDSLPRVVPGLYNAQNLHLVKFHDQPAALVKLRSQFKDLGLRTQENQLTYAIRRSELSRKNSNGSYAHTWSERAFNTVSFDWTCQYGMSPGRPLLIVAALAVIFWFVYIFAQVNPGPNGGIWAVWDEHRIKQAEGSKQPQQLTDGFPSGRSEFSVFLLALYFSLLSATRIGWRELNVGTWITRIQPREYSLRATGWVRVVSGIQSLISVYLVALAILTYFGTPFEY